MLTDEALEGFKNYVIKTVSYAKYLIGSTYYTQDISDIYIDDDGLVCIDMTINPSSSSSVTVTEIQLYDKNGTLWLSKTDSITRESSQYGIFYRITLDITET